MRSMNGATSPAAGEVCAAAATPGAVAPGAPSLLERLLRAVGVGGATAVIGAASVAASMGMYLLVTLAFGVGTYQGLGLLRAAIISAVVAPPIAYLAMGMVRRLEAGRRNLAESEAKFRTLLETLAYGCCETDLDLAITFANGPLAAIAGIAPDAMPGRRLTDLVGGAPGSALARTLREVREGRLARAEVRFEVRTPAGEVRTVEGTVSLLRDDSGGARGFRGIFRDVSDEARLDREREQLEERAQQVQKMEALAVLAGGIAHDLNNILSGVVAYPEIIMPGLPPDSPLRGDLAAIRESGLKAAGIVDDLLTMARRSPARREPVSIRGVVEGYLASPEHRRLLAAHPGVRVETAIADGLPWLDGSPVHLHKSVMNLVANAAEAIPDSGTVRISAEAVEVGPGETGPAGAGPGRHVVLRVADDGAGIPAADLPRVFEPFFTRKVLGRSGTGLGLSIVWGTAQDHGGQVAARSEEGRGTTITLVLPAREGEPAPPAPADSPRRGAGETVLVVDDSADQRRLAERLLRALGYEVRAAAGGEEAVAAVREALAAGRPPDVLLLDVLMEPGIDGVETLRRIRSLVPAQRAVFMSGYSENRLEEDGLDVGTAGFLRKPYRLEELAGALRAELEHPAG